MCLVPRLLAFFFIAVISCTVAGQGVLDRAPDGKKFRRAVTGGGPIVAPDLTTPTNEILKRFESEWRLEQTYKDYWIGYTDDMYSLAARGDSAIPEILQFAKNTKSGWAKIAAVYSLHLTGIDCAVAGRFHEKFKNKKAREALYELLEDDQVNELIVKLLSRDPWKSDQAKLLKLLTSENPKLNAVIVNVLTRQKDLGPFAPTVQKDPNKLEVVLVTLKERVKLGELRKISVTDLLDDEAGSVYQETKSCYINWRFDKQETEFMTFLSKFPESRLDRLLTVALDPRRRSYSDCYCRGFENKLTQSKKKDEIRIYTTAAARKIWLQWQDKTNK